ncbi:MAG: ASKHA domain-containing protein [Desulfobacterales bacterium]
MNAPSWVFPLRLTPPSLRDNTADADRLAAALRRETGAEVLLPLELLRDLPAVLRAADWRVRCALFREGERWIATGVFPGEEGPSPLGAAVDLGTTRVAVRLLELSPGRILAESGFDNPQTAIGPDVLTRIHHAATPGGLEALASGVRRALSEALSGLLAAHGRDPRGLTHLAVAGNTAMTHLLLGLDPGRMIREPYIPVVNRPGLIAARDLDLAVAPAARVFVFPNIGSYFGGDLVAGILFSGLHRRAEPAILVDVGTNAEVVLGCRDWMIGCAGAAGPALEGGMSRIGMTAAPGAVDRVAVDPATGELVFHTIGGAPPRGICGSGMIDLAACLFRAGLIDARGRFVPAACGGRLLGEGGDRLLLVPADRSGTGEDLTIGQAEIDSLIRSKAAMYTILETLCLSVGLRLEEIDTFFVAGTFGCFIDPRSAATIGMLPALPAERFLPLGNSSLEGASLLLACPGCLEEIPRIRDRITYLELNVNADFMNRFSAAKFLPHTDAARFAGSPGGGSR